MTTNLLVALCFLIIYLTYNTAFHWHYKNEMLFVRGYGFTPYINTRLNDVLLLGKEIA
ncbi:hypothetical protein MTsDn5_37200 [Alteromonas gracilis]